MRRNSVKLLSIGVQVAATILITALSHSQAQGIANDNELSEQAKKIKIIDPRKIILDATGTKGSTTLILENNAGSDISQARITIGSFKRYINEGDAAEVGGGANLSAPPDQSSKSFCDITNFKQREPRYIKVDVEGFLEAGECFAPILFDGTPIGDLIVWRLQPNLTVEITSGLSSADLSSTALALPSLVSIHKITLEYGKDAQIVLKNSDSMTYPIHWQIFVGQNVSDPGKLTLTPNGTDVIRVTPSDNWFDAGVSGLFKDQEVAGSLRLTFKPPTRTEYPNPKTIDIPFKALLRRHSVSTQAWAGGIASLIILALGMACSIAIRNWVPNVLRRSRIKEALDQLDNALQHLSDRIGSFLRVPIRVERHRLYNYLRSQYAFSPDFPNDAKECEDKLQKLNDRKETLESIDDVYCRIDKTQRVPPTLKDRVEGLLEQAISLLRRTDLYDLHFPEVKAQVEKLIQGANESLDFMSKGDPKFAEELANRVSKLAPLFSGLNNAPSDTLANSEAYKLLNKELPFILEVLNYKNAFEIEKGDYYRIDLNIRMLDLGLKYVRLCDHHTSDPESEQTWKEWGNRFIINLKMGDLEGLRLAALTLEELDEEISAQTILTQIKSDPPKLTIRREAVEVRVKQSIQLRVEFDFDALNRSAARNEFICIWDFGHDELKETAWELSHYFPEAKMYTVKVSFAERRTMKYLQNDNKDITITERIPVAPPVNTQMRERARVEIVGLTIALLGATAGLIAGARDQLSNLELSAALIAIFLAGFATDQIKDLLTKRQS